MAAAMAPDFIRPSKLGRRNHRLQAVENSLRAVPITLPFRLSPPQWHICASRPAGVKLFPG